MGEVINYDDYIVVWMCFDEFVEIIFLFMFDEEYGIVWSLCLKFKDVI